MKTSVTVSVFLLIVLTGLATYLHINSYSTQSGYVTSEECQDCHQLNYESWKHNTLHPRQFRPKTTDDEILGDFNSTDPALTFKKEDIEYIIGNKWEQVYVRKIDGEYYPLPAKWYIIKKQWVPYKVDNWKDTPMSKMCNGCHTTGFNPVSLKFSEFGIGCEACHGPGNTHVKNKLMEDDSYCNFCHSVDEELHTESDIIRSVSATVCGQCHNRGKNAPQDKIHGSIFSFPVKFKPGDNLNKSMISLTPEKDKKGKFFWGNGIAKNRHQEYGDWSISKHANSAKLLKQEYNENDNRGKLSEKCLHCHSTDFRHADKDNKPTLETVKFGITCVACHEPHGRDKLLPSHGDGVTLCGGCHVDGMSHNVNENGKRHYPCPTAVVSCADCHMPKVVKTGGFFSIRNHGFRIITPMEAEQNAMPSSCQNAGCHNDKTIEWAIDEFTNFYLNKNNDLTQVKLEK